MKKSIILLSLIFLVSCIESKSDKSNSTIMKRDIKKDSLYEDYDMFDAAVRNNLDD